MRITEPALDPRNLFGFADPTPAAVRWGVVIVTLGELVAAIAERSGEDPGHVRHLVKAWIRDGLLPKPKIVSVPGRRGTRGDYGDAVFISYFVVKGLRPKGKPLSFMTTDPVIDRELFSAQGEYLSKYMDWLFKEKKLDFKQALKLEKENRLPPPPPDLDMQWRERLQRRQEQLANLKPKIKRLRLNTEELAALLPIARGEKPKKIEELYLFYHVFSLDPPGDLFDDVETDTSTLYLKVKAIRKIWSVACKKETGMKPERVDVHQGDVVAYCGEKEIWRLSKSKFRAVI